MRRFTRNPIRILLCAIAACALATIASAQTLPVDVDPRLPLPALPTPAADALLQETNATLQSLRGDVAYTVRARALARAHPTRVALDPQGAAMRRHEFVVHGIDESMFEAARVAGFEIIGRERLEALDMTTAVLRDRRRRAPARGLAALRAALPDAETDFHHLYLPAASPTPRSPAAVAAPAARSSTTPAPTTAPMLRIGLIDGGVDGRDPAFARVRIERHGCGAAIHPQAHGTAVARRLVDGHAGALYAADLWCGDAVARGTLGLVAALDWLSRQRVAVVNISLVGPDNPLLRRAVTSMIARGHVLVAAAGNDGPAAPPLFPAAYPDVIGVGAIDAKLRPLPESASGPHLDFCAPGVVDARRRGTSFAAPLVARLAALPLSEPTPGAASGASTRLGAQALDVGTPGRDPRCGDGALAGT